MILPDKRNSRFLTVLCSKLLVFGLALSFLAMCPQAALAHGNGFYQQTNLVSDIRGVARFTDPNLVNSWGLSHSSTGPWFVSDNGTGVATAYRGNGKAFPSGSAPLVITIPLPGGKPGGTPTGNVFNNTKGFVVSQHGKSSPSQFIFATEDGTISGWDPTVDPTHAIIAVNRSTVAQHGFVGAVYKGLALGRSGSRNFIYATNFRFGTVEMFDAKFTLVKSFTDPQLASKCPIPGPPAQCFAPFGIQNIGGKLYVTFALQDAAHHDDVAGAGNGFVDVFDTNGQLLRRLISDGQLNSPWGLALAPEHFGPFSNDLWVGNFGDGQINVFDPCTGAFLGQPKNQFGRPIAINGLWGLGFGNGGQAGARNTLFFAAGIADESHGLFGSIQSENN
ncbi:hypothetical protein KSF_040260 [Reticulibacter mediterranei]|uniref:TIGR03118 family protein n=1 Tax=Reticulibacter mediterranei TaxID=2778369 RepID=A0A8J3IHZ2_9CHLR|nr:TIGR03118 family protein [Reticulibacter mediterranei]GHO93978.1 hypothetical protein KSF_040260 [Reticulibacter mediterranei]